MRYFYGVMKGSSLPGRNDRYFLTQRGKILVRRVREDLFIDMIFNQKNNLVLAFYVKGSTCVTY